MNISRNREEIIMQSNNNDNYEGKKWVSSYQAFKENVHTLGNYEAFEIIEKYGNISEYSLMKKTDVIFIILPLFFLSLVLTGRMEHSNEAIRSIFFSDLICLAWYLWDIIPQAFNIYKEKAALVPASAKRYTNQSFISFLSKYDSKFNKPLSEDEALTLAENTFKQIRMVLIKKLLKNNLIIWIVCCALASALIYWNWNAMLIGIAIGVLLGIACSCIINIALKYTKN